MSEQGAAPQLVRMAEVLGHDVQRDAMQRAILAGRLHHAYLVSGPEGVGRRRLALAVASLANCERPEAGDACGRCGACVRQASGQPPDVHLVEPDGRFIRIDRIRAITQMTNFRPYASRYRFVIIDPVDAMQEAAANALLKTLEEPGGETVFLLLTSQPHRVLSTVRSRCQPLRLGALPVGVVEELLVRQGVDGSEAAVLARLAAGSPGRALELRQSPRFAERGELLDQLVAMPHQSAADLVAVAEWFCREKDATEERLVMLGLLVRDAVLVANGQRGRASQPDLLDGLEELAQRATTPQLLSWFSRIEAARLQLLGNVNPRMLCESLFLELAATPSGSREDIRP